MVTRVTRLWSCFRFSFDSRLAVCGPTDHVMPWWNAFG